MGEVVEEAKIQVQGCQRCSRRRQTQQQQQQRQGLVETAGECQRRSGAAEPETQPSPTAVGAGLPAAGAMSPFSPLQPTRAARQLGWRCATALAAEKCCSPATAHR